MKKNWLLMLVSALLLVVLTACQSADDKEPEEIKVPVNESMELESENEENDPDSPSATYVVKEGEYESFLETYEQDLVDDGWEVTLDEKPDFLILTKEDKEIKIMPVQLDDEIKVFIYEEE